MAKRSIAKRAPAAVADKVAPAAASRTASKPEAAAKTEVAAKPAIAKPVPKAVAPKRPATPEPTKIPEPARAAPEPAPDVRRVRPPAPALKVADAPLAKRFDPSKLTAKTAKSELGAPSRADVAAKPKPAAATTAPSASKPASEVARGARRMQPTTLVKVAEPPLADLAEPSRLVVATSKGELVAPPQPAPAAKPEPAAKPAAAAKPEPAAKPKAPEPAPSQTPMPNFEQLSRNIARYIEEGGKVLAAYMKPRENGGAPAAPSNELGDMFTTLGRVAEYYATDAQRAFKAQADLSGRFMELWSSTLRRLQGEATAPVAAPEPNDKRFADPDWRENPYFDFLKQAYVLTSRWADDLVRRADELDPHTRDKAAFYLKQVTSALAPSNFLPTNPELLKTTLAESGENLVRGLHMMAEDIEAGHGSLRIRQADAAKFKLGVNLAVTPGKVVFRNELIELIQYAPSTPQVFKRPLLIVPPWINKFYVLDLNPDKSFIRWAVSQGLTVFVISWVNPDERHADKGFEAYMREGIFAALEVIEQATGERDVSAIGYCVGGTLLAVTLAFMAEIGDDRIKSATFFTTQVDFADPGDLKIFVDAEQLKSIETKMADTGYLDGAHMATAFNMLRPNDLIWSYWINNYLKGKEPMAFDLLVWNSDSTRMPAANHRFYLRHCYLQNDLTHDRLTVEGRPISLKNVTIPVYNLAAREDHIAPARSVFNGAKHFGGPMRYVLAGSGHIAGVVNPPMKPKYQFWTGEAPNGAFEDWLAAATETPGSWWPDWVRWIGDQAPAKVPAREPGGGKIEPLGDAPGEYVKVRV